MSISTNVECGSVGAPGCADLAQITCALVRDKRWADLTMRQIAIFLRVYDDAEGPQTVRGLAAHMGIQKPPVTRALDRLTDLGLVARVEDPNDRRSIFVARTPMGEEYVGFVRQVVAGGIVQ